MGYAPVYMGDNPMTKACGLSSCAYAQTIQKLTLVAHSFHLQFQMVNTKAKQRNILHT